MQADGNREKRYNQRHRVMSRASCDACDRALETKVRQQSARICRQELSVHVVADEG